MSIFRTFYFIRSKLNGFVLDIQGSNREPRAPLISYPLNGATGTPNQLWRFLPVPGSDGTYLISSALNNFVVDITGSNTAPVTPIIAFPTNGQNGTSNQQWELVPVPNTKNTYLIKTKLNGFVLDVEGSNQSAGTRIISFPINGATGTPNQHWELVMVPVMVGTTYLIKSKLHGFVLDITGSNREPRTPIISYPLNGATGTPNQHWRFVPVPGSEGTYLISSVLNNFVIDITGSNTAPVTPIIAYPTNGQSGTPNQHWELIPVPNTDNTFLIKTKLNGFVLDVEGSNKAAGTRIISYPVNGAIGTPNQYWEFVAI